MSSQQQDPVKAVARHVGINLLAEAIKFVFIASLPFLLAAVTVVAGILQPMPWVYILVAATSYLQPQRRGFCDFPNFGSRYGSE